MTGISTATAAPSDDRTLVHLAVVLAGLLAIRVIMLALAGTNLMFDEAQYWAWSQEPAFGYFSKPPMIAWIIGAMTGLCGHGEFCVRLASPVLYTGTALFAYLAGKALYDARIGFWAAVVLATTPGASFSSGLISTDVPLLLFWTAALFAWARLLDTRSWGWTLALGAAIGLGLLSKYAMVYFYLCAAVYLVAAPEARWLLRDARGLALLALPALFLAPNVVWNLENGLATLSHTAANAKWGGSLFHPLKALEFFGGQFGVFGPILFGALLWIVARAPRHGSAGPERLLLAFSVPVIALVLTQAFLSRAHANWAAAAYPAAAILVTATLLNGGYRKLFRTSLALHLAFLVLISAGNVFAPRLAAAPWGAAFKRLVGWDEVGQAVRDKLQARAYGAVLTEDRVVTSQMLYYLRDVSTPLVAWRPFPAPRDHFELTRPFMPDTREPLLLVTLRPSVEYVTRHFERVEALATARVPAGRGSPRTVRFYVLDGYKSR
ncbi:MAG: glycosyltransferase family 39 protein [Hyphomicrobiales bacterium]|nr:glycosyltransferase family 39 protein [Hyphomicrobiales bacterium]